MNSMHKNKSYRTLDLFAGIGGLRIAFERAGFNTVFANDIDPNCKLTYDANFDSSLLTIGDISKIPSCDLPEFDVLLAGFPCQPFSVAGYRKGFSDSGRGDLFFEIVRILSDKKPATFLLENVKNLKTHDKGRTYKIIREELKNAEYEVKEQVLNSMTYGNVPQNRERIFIVGFRSERALSMFEFPNEIKLTKTIEDMLDAQVPDKYYYKTNHPYYERLDESIKAGTFYQWRRTYVRENKSGVCPTLTANMGTGGHNVPIIRDFKGVRKLTPTECKRLQGFPEEFILPHIADSKLYKQIGNSVTVSVVESIARRIKNSLEFEKNVSRTSNKRAI